MSCFKPVPLYCYWETDNICLLFSDSQLLVRRWVVLRLFLCIVTEKLITFACCSVILSCWWGWLFCIHIHCFPCCMCSVKCHIQASCHLWIEFKRTGIAADVDMSACATCKAYDCTFFCAEIFILWNVTPLKLAKTRLKWKVWHAQCTQVTNLVNSSYCLWKRRRKKKGVWLLLTCTHLHVRSDHLVSGQVVDMMGGWLQSLFL